MKLYNSVTFLSNFLSLLTFIFSILKFFFLNHELEWINDTRPRNSGHMPHLKPVNLNINELKRNVCLQILQQMSDLNKVKQRRQRGSVCLVHGWVYARFDQRFLDNWWQIFENPEIARLKLIKTKIWLWRSTCWPCPQTVKINVFSSANSGLLILNDRGWLSGMSWGCSPNHREKPSLTSGRVLWVFLLNKTTLPL